MDIVKVYRERKKVMACCWLEMETMMMMMMMMKKKKENGGNLDLIWVSNTWKF